MLKGYRQDRGRKGEEGNVIFFLAAIILGLITWFVTFQINTTIIESARIQLEFKVSGISSMLRSRSSHWISIENDLSNPIQSFRSALKSIFTTPADPKNPSGPRILAFHPYRRIRISRVIFVLPTMQSGEAGESTTPYDLAATGDPPYLATSSGFPFATFDAACDNLPGFDLEDNDCLFFGSAHDSSEVNDLLPEDLIVDTENAGNAIIIIVEAKVRTFFGGLLRSFGASTDVTTPTIRAVRADWSPIRGDFFPNEDGIRFKVNDRRDFTNFPQDHPGLSIAISPHVETTSYNDRFRMPTAPEYSNLNGFDAFQDGRLDSNFEASTSNPPQLPAEAGLNLTNWYEIPPVPNGSPRQYSSDYVVYNPPNISPFQKSAAWFEHDFGKYTEYREAGQKHGIPVSSPNSFDCSSCTASGSCVEADCISGCTCVQGNAIPDCSACDNGGYVAPATGAIEGASGCDCASGSGCMCVEEAGKNAVPTDFTTVGGGNCYTIPGTPDQTFCYPVCNFVNFTFQCTNQCATIPGTPAKTICIGGATEWTIKDDGIDSDFAEMLAACANPLVMVRNAFLSTIVELASRHGQLRSTSEVLMVGTQHQVGYSEAGGHRFGGRDYPPEHSNPPVLMVPRGMDMVRPDLEANGVGHFQLPYVFLYSRFDGNPSTAGATAPPLEESFGSHKGGWIFPFRKADNSEIYCEDGDDERWCAHQAIISQQLRMCHHLYSHFIKRPYPDSIYEPDDAVSKNTIVPLDYQPVDSLAVSASNSEPASPWDQDCPWGGSSETGHCTAAEAGGGAAAARPKKEGLTAAELVSSIGTIQTCPYKQLVINGTKSFVCKKPCADSKDDPTTATDESCSNLATAATHPVARDNLRPDYQSLIEYLNGGDAVNSPGLFPLRPNYHNGGHPPVGANSQAPNTPMPFDKSAYTNSNSGNNPLLLVLHRTPLGNEGGECRDSAYPNGSDASDEVALLQDLTDPSKTGSRWRNRPITVVFIPARVEEAKRRVCLLKAFNIFHETDNPGGNPINRFVEYSPYSDGDAFHIGPTGIDRTSAGAHPVPDDIIHREYWSELLLPGSSGCEEIHPDTENDCIPIEHKDSVYHRAHTVFLDLLTATERKL